MLSIPVPLIPQGWRAAAPFSQAAQHLSWLADGKDSYGWASSPAPAPRYGWDDAPVCSPHIPSPSDVVPGQHERWTVDPQRCTPHQRSFDDGSALLIAHHNDHAFFWPWPVTGHGSNVDTLDARIGWRAYTQSYAVFPWRHIKATLPERDRFNITSTLRSIAKASADLLSGSGLTDLTLEMELMPACVDDTGALLQPWANITALVGDTTQAQQDHLTDAFQRGTDAAQAALARLLPGHAAQMRCLQQGMVTSPFNPETGRRLTDRAERALSYGVVHTYRIGGAHGALRAHKVLASFAPTTTTSP